jgi:hypothetical protein
MESNMNQERLDETTRAFIRPTHFFVAVLFLLVATGCTSNSSSSADSGVEPEGSCMPKFDCGGQEAECGVIEDGCGVLLDCGGGCAEGTTCGGAGRANVCGCTPTTCESAGANCGTVEDGCGGSLECGTCSDDE